jgi:hypothetical protein
MRVHERTFINGIGPALNESEYLFALRSDGSTSQIFLGKDNNGSEAWISRTIRNPSEKRRVFPSDGAAWGASRLLTSSTEKSLRWILTWICARFASTLSFLYYRNHERLDRRRGGSYW